jgi:DNA-binding NtrC family response regulator
VASIVVIDDNESLRSPLRAILEAAGHRVREAADGAVAMGLLREQPADVVFCDLFMPEQEGFETIRLLRRELPGVKVVAMSGGGFGGRIDLLDFAVKLGAALALRKPFDAGDALAAVDAVLAGRR